MTLIQTDQPMKEISDICIYKYNVYNAPDLAISLMAIEKPKELFEAKNQRLQQEAWYEQQLKEYREQYKGKRNRGFWHFW